MRYFVYLIVFLVLFIGPFWLWVSGQVKLGQNYQTANRDSAHLAEDPAKVSDAIVQVYAARSFNWRGLFATHTWIAVKPKNAPQYTVYQVVGWRTFSNLPALTEANDIPDRNWFGNKPTMLVDIRGSQAEALIPQIEAAVKSYPYPDTYRLWPGPNSNTFTAYVGRQVPGLGLVMPSNAVGKDYLDNGDFVAKAPSNTGYQFSVFGLFGVLAAKKEGFEINMLGLIFGVKPEDWAVLWPGVGEIKIWPQKTA